MGYPALKKDQVVSRKKTYFGYTNVFVWHIIINNAKHHVIELQVKFRINFDYNLDQLQKQAEVKFEAKRYTEFIRN